MYKIEKNIEMPKLKYPFADMEIGDSFFVPFEQGVSKQQFHRRVSANAAIRAKKFNEKYKTKRNREGVRVFRIE